MAQFKKKDDYATEKMKLPSALLICSLLPIGTLVLTRIVDVFWLSMLYIKSDNSMSLFLSDTGLGAYAFVDSSLDAYRGGHTTVAAATTYNSSSRIQQQQQNTTAAATYNSRSRIQQQQQQHTTTGEYNSNNTTCVDLTCFDLLYKVTCFSKRNFVANSLVHCSGCNYSTLTFDGVDRMGERLAEEVDISRLKELPSNLLVAGTLQVDFATQLLNRDVSASHYRTPIRFYPGVPDAC
ncbi:hypothetical protein SSX86_024735 [Deinandra increscens subsp. villosa]|uniref:Uncharacterized protein n=1 Tax=Deinandra increscens subsp. villosa TaxID=3103831 RepID=A0AAP0CCX4_9ASTR